MIKRKLFIMIIGLSLLISFCGLIYGLVSVDVLNYFETGIVDISLEEYKKEGDTEVKWEDNQLVFPGAIVSKIPRITNKGSDCYIRAKITFTGSDKIKDTMLLGVDGKWLKADDGYYYYAEALPHGEQIDLFQGLKIPEDLALETQGQLFYVDIDVDAIQSKNFVPDFNSAAPWGSVEIVKCEKSGLFDVNSFKQSDTKSFRIVYQGDAKKLVKNSDDFFANFPYLMPGDVYSDSAEIVNSAASDLKLYFRSEANDSSALLDKIKLKITTVIDGKEKVFYEGNLRAAALSESTVLDTIPGNKKGVFHFEITVPPELNNQYSLSSSYVKWIFSTEPIQNTDVPKTGDESNIMLWSSMFIISLAGLCSMLVAEKKRKDGCRQ